MKNLLRSIQVNFPKLQNFKSNLAHNWRWATMSYSDKEYVYLKELFKDVERPLFIDIGANRGQSLDSFIYMNVYAKMIAFEPNPHVYKYTKNLYADFDNIKIYNTAVGRDKSSMTLYTPIYKQWIFDGLSSLRYKNASDWLETRMFNYNEDYLKVDEHKVSVVPLDNYKFKQKVNFIKMDVQGAEYDVLLGAIELLKRDHPVLLIETPQEQELKLLESLGYKPYWFDGKKTLHDGVGKNNTIFM